MTSKSPEIQFKLFLYAALAGNLIYAIPVFIDVLVFNLMDIDVLFFISVPFALLSIPISAFISWLMAKGSNWENALGAIVTAFSIPGRYYAFLFGGLLGFHFFWYVRGHFICDLVLFSGSLINNPCKEICI